MNSYSLLIAVHITTAILGLGQIGGLLFLPFEGLERPTLVKLARIFQGSLLIMLLSGIGLVSMTHWAFGQTGWVRVSFGLTLFLGFLSGMVSRLLRSAHGEGILSKVRLLLLACGVTVFSIVYLMEAKPW